MPKNSCVTVLQIDNISATSITTIRITSAIIAQIV